MANRPQAISKATSLAAGPAEGMGSKNDHTPAGLLRSQRGVASRLPHFDRNYTYRPSEVRLWMPTTPRAVAAYGRPTAWLVPRGPPSQSRLGLDSAARFTPEGDLCQGLTERERTPPPPLTQPKVYSCRAVYSPHIRGAERSLHRLHIRARALSAAYLLLDPHAP